MAVGKKDMIKAWSYSRLTTYEQCPRKAKHKFIDKIEEPAGPWLIRGQEVHTILEKKIRENKIDKAMPKDLANIKSDFTKLIGQLKAILVEQQWAFTMFWDSTGWFDPTAWCRVVIDLFGLRRDGSALVLDYKTGKYRDGYERQLRLYAHSVFTRFSFVNKVECMIWYVDQNKRVSETFTRKEDSDNLRKEWREAPKAMLRDQSFEPRPGNYCRWCTYSVSQGGPCKF